MTRILLTLLLFAAPLAAEDSGDEAGVYWAGKDPSVLIPAAPLAATVASQVFKLPLNGYVSVWSQDCTAEPCAIPLPLVKNRSITYELALPQAPGQAQTGAVKEIFSLPAAGELSLALSFYAVCPYAAALSSAADSPSKAEHVPHFGPFAKSAGQAGVTGTCPALYFQAQAELAGAAGAFCAADFNEKDFTPFPVLMCGGGKTRGVRFAITLHRDRL